MRRRVGTLFVSGALVAGGLVALASGSAPASAAATFTPGDIAVYRVGDGSAALSSSGTPVFIDEYSPTGQLVESIPLPTTASGANNPLVASGTAGSEGLISLSGDHNYLAATGYDAAVGTANLSASAAATVHRTVAIINSSGSVDTTTALNNAADANNPRSAVTNDGKEVWVAGGASGIVYAPIGASTGTDLVSSTFKNNRQLEIVGGQLYTSADPTKASTTVATVGTGLPTTGATNAITDLFPFSSVQSGFEPYQYSLLSINSASAGALDTLYVADNGDGLVTKFVKQTGAGTTGTGAWIAKGSVGLAGVTGLTANDANGVVSIYASTPTNLYSLTDSSGFNGAFTSSVNSLVGASANEGFDGIALTPGTITGTGNSAPPPPAPPVVTPAQTGLPAAINDPTNATDALTLSDPNAGVDPATLTLSATSSNQAVVPNSGISITGTGANRTLAVTPLTAGEATITLKVTAPDTTSSTTTISYAASTDLGVPSARYYSGAGNGSTAIDVGDGYFIVGDDESNVLRMYQHGVSGPPVKTFDFTSQLPFGATEIDIEAAARTGNTIYWTGSMSQNDSGVLEPARSTIFATTISGTGASTTLTFVKAYSGLSADLVAWDEANGSGLGANALGLAASTASGLSGHDATALNVEGMEFAQGSSSTVYLAFRAPLEPTSVRNMAMLIPVTNVDAVVNGTAAHATFGAPIFWNLGGLGIRDIRKNADGTYLISAGTADGTNNVFNLYVWDGNPAHAPRLSETLPQLPSASNAGSWETVISVPDPLVAGSIVPMLQDDGDTIWYTDGLTSKTGLSADLQKSMGVDFSYDLPTTQSTSTTLTADSSSSLPGTSVTYTATISDDPTATGSPSGSVDFSDGGTDIGTCTTQTVTNGVATCTVTYTAAGDHSVVATYSGDSNFSGSASAALGHIVNVAESLSWTPPNSIVYGTALSATQLDATSTVPGTFTYTVASGPAGTVGNTLTTASVLPAGSYQLQATFTPTDTTTYSTSTVSVSFAVTPAPLSVTASSGTFVYGGTAPTISASYLGFVNGDTSASIVTSPNCSTTATSTSGVGSYPSTCSGAVEPNYTITYVPGSVTVTPATLTVKASNASRFYGQANPAFAYTVTGYLNGDSATTAFTGLPAVTTTATAVSNVGTYPITASIGTLKSTNYTFAFTGSTLTVVAAPIVVGTANVSIVKSILAGGLQFSTLVLNAATGLPAAGVTVTITAHVVITGYVFGCTAVTNSAGVASCSSTQILSGILTIPPTFTATVPASQNYTAGTASGFFTL